MSANKKLLILPGDGIGPEVMRQVRRVIDWMDRRRKVTFDVQDGLVGGAAIDQYGVPVSDETMADALSVDAVLLGAVGGPKWDNIGFDKRPEAGLLRLRKELGLFANLRPATVFDALVDASTLKADIVRGLDLMIVRELTGGVYFGEPRGIEELPDGQRRGVNTQVYTTAEIQRVARVAFELARKRQNKLCSVEKANVMESGLLWRQEVTKLHQAEYSDVQLSHMYADNCAMQLDQEPQAVRRDRHRQPVRRHAVGRSRHDDRLARHAAVGLARRSGRDRPPPRPVRAGAWFGPGHRRHATSPTRSRRCSASP